MKARLTIAVIACALALAGCHAAMRLDSVKQVGLSNTRPQSTIGQEPRGPWKVYSVAVRASEVRTLKRWGSTFHLIVFNCRTPEEYDAEDAYIGGTALNLGWETDAPIRRASDGQNTLTGIAYVPTLDLKSGSELCFQATGGNMAGFAFMTNIVRVQA